VKANQFCSVCKQWLDMEVVPTGDDDDGVIWYRCPQCQGYLPQLGGDHPPAARSAGTGDGSRDEAPEPASRSVTAADDMPWDSPADMMAARGIASRQPSAAGEDVDAGDEDDDDDAAAAGSDPGPAATEPLAEYAAMLAALDPTTAVPYRPWETYEVGQCIHHLAWDDCGVVVAKEALPGGRKAVKCYFAAAGVVRLIEGASR